MPPNRRPALPDVRVYLIASSRLCGGRAVETVVEAALRGGVAMVQMREKAGSSAFRVDIGRRLRQLTRSYAVPLIVNDDPELAVELDADGVHLGQDDLGLQAARAIVGPARWIGLSTHDAAQIVAAADMDVDMLGLGPVFETATKDAGAPLGAARAASLARMVGRLPVFLIGGIDEAGAASLGALGVRRVAVSSFIMGAADPCAATVALRRLLA